MFAEYAIEKNLRHQQALAKSRDDLVVQEKAIETEVRTGNYS
jgi:hypothetical protein